MRIVANLTPRYAAHASNKNAAAGGAIPRRGSQLQPVVGWRVAIPDCQFTRTAGPSSRIARRQGMLHSPRADSTTENTPLVPSASSVHTK